MEWPPTGVFEALMERAQASFGEVQLVKSRPTVVQKRSSLHWKMAIVLTLLVCVALGTAWSARGDVFGDVLDDRLERLREVGGVRVIRSDITSAGLTGVALHDVIVRRPDEGGSLWFAVERMEVYPDILAAMTLDFRPRKIVLDGVEMNIVTGNGKSGSDTKGDLVLGEISDSSLGGRLLVGVGI